jgi:uncharacterized protein YbcV (DUF1398 family)
MISRSRYPTLSVDQEPTNHQGHDEHVIKDALRRSVAGEFEFRPLRRAVLKNQCRQHQNGSIHFAQFAYRCEVVFA